VAARHDLIWEGSLEWDRTERMPLGACRRTSYANVLARSVAAAIAGASRRPGGAYPPFEAIEFYGPAAVALANDLVIVAGRGTATVREDRRQSREAEQAHNDFLPRSPMDLVAADGSCTNVARISSHGKGSRLDQHSLDSLVAETSSFALKIRLGSGLKVDGPAIVAEADATAVAQPSRLDVPARGLRRSRPSDAKGSSDSVLPPWRIAKHRA
jgi:hypothetical protein